MRILYMPKTKYWVKFETNMHFENNQKFAQNLDSADKLKQYKEEFIFPSNSDNVPTLYFCGNSLGLQPKGALHSLQVELTDWGKLGVEGHFHGNNPWFHYHKFLTDYSANVVGANPIEVVVMNHLTVNLHLLFATFYRPTKNRFKIIMEAGAFPSDMYAIESQALFHGLNPDEVIIEISPRDGEFTLRTEDILDTIEQNKTDTALVFFSGVQYYTGQYFDIRSITQKAHEVGAFAGFDLAHAAGNLDLKLHEWDVDFAAWCSYKYLNSGPGNVGGVFIHEKHCTNPSTPRLSGWWGHQEESRFLMKKGYIPELGAAGWQLSNAPVFGMAVHLVSLKLFETAKIENLRNKSIQLTNYLQFVLEDAKSKNLDLDFNIITPSDSNSRGAQLSLLFEKNGRAVFDHITKNNSIVDWREPNVIRIAPAPLYNSFEDVQKLGEIFASFSKI